MSYQITKLLTNLHLPYMETNLNLTLSPHAERELFVAILALAKSAITPHLEDPAALNAARLREHASRWTDDLLRELAQEFESFDGLFLHEDGTWSEPTDLAQDVIDRTVRRVVGKKLRYIERENGWHWYQGGLAPDWRDAIPCRGIAPSGISESLMQCEAN